MPEIAVLFSFTKKILEILFFADTLWGTPIGAPCFTTTPTIFENAKISGHATIFWETRHTVSGNATISAYIV